MADLSDLALILVHESELGAQAMDWQDPALALGARMGAICRRDVIQTTDG